jgi:hypothetical protein
MSHSVNKCILIQINHNSENNKLTPPKISKRLQKCFPYTLPKQNFISLGSYIVQIIVACLVS